MGSDARDRAGRCRSCSGACCRRCFSPARTSSNMLADLTEIALMALPMTLIIVAAEIDLSVASVLGASSALMGVLWHMGLPMPARDRAGAGCRRARGSAQRPRDRASSTCRRWRSPSARSRCFAASRTCCSATRRSRIFRAAYTAFGMDTRRRDLHSDAVRRSSSSARCCLHGAAAGHARSAAASMRSARIRPRRAFSGIEVAKIRLQALRAVRRDERARGRRLHAALHQRARR